MRILVTGASGLIGRALIPSLAADGHKIVCLSRTPGSGDHRHIYWDPHHGTLDADAVENFDAVIHLAGESIVGRWTAEKKARIRDSRVNGTRLLCETLARVQDRPLVLVAASAIGFYGDRGDQLLNEESSPGSLFLSRVAKEWEAASEPASQHGIQVVNLRIGFVLSKVGSGRQYLSWIAIDDVVGAIGHAILSDTLRGPVNAVAPHAVTNQEFTKTLGRVLWRPTLFPLPAFAAHLALGEMADNLLLASARVEPARLLASGYEFRFPELKGALRHVLGKD